MNREYHRWYSPHLCRDMELLVFGWGGARVVVMPARAGRFHDYEDWGIVEGIRDKLENGWIHVCQMEIHLAIGETDPFLASNHQFSLTLHHLGIGHQDVRVARPRPQAGVLAAHGCALSVTTALAAILQR